MYTQEQIQDRMKQIQKQVSGYDENSIDKAREKLQAARDLVTHIESGGTSVYTIYEAHQKYDVASRELDDAIKFSSHLQMAKRIREEEAVKAAEKVKEQQAHAAAEKADFRAQAKERWLAVGGNEHQFSEQFESMWTEEVRRRTTQAVGLKEQFMESMRKSGMYGSI
ncbi:MAG TPA: hypothetical protein VHV10_20635 [Ktedonobacteraceae bacterium]|nr:hypothetical protein [Ktedonobacteraceae bacterium]